MAIDQAAPTRAEQAGVLPALTGHAVRSFVRNPVAAFFSLAFPLTFLVIVASMAGREVAQFLVAPFAVFGVAQASFTLLAVDAAVLRESGVLLRLRAAPVPAWTVLAARIGASIVASGLSVVLLTAVGALVYGVEIIWPKVPAMLVTLLLGIACCAALGLALAAVTRTVASAQALAQGVLIPLAFISEVFIVGADLPRWLSSIGSLLPLKHFAQAMAETFRSGGGSGFSPGHLLVLVAWTVAGVFVALQRFSWQPRGAAGPRIASQGPGAAPARLSAPQAPARRHDSSVVLLTGQIRYALLGLRRDALAVFFSVVFPALLLALFPTVFGDGQVHGLRMAQYLFAGMLAYTVAVTAFVDLPEGVAGARSAGVLKRLRGTPLPMRWYVAGRVSAALLTALLSGIVLAAVGIGFLGVRVDPFQLPALLLTMMLGSMCFAALGLMVAALLPSARSLVAVTLGTLLPLCFVSEIFVVGGRPLPAWLTTVAEVFPLRHLLQAVLAATRPEGAGVAAAHLAVLAGWTVLALLVTWRHRAALT
jgi:ABC-type multidrug transport system permease subunit